MWAFFTSYFSSFWNSVFGPLLQLTSRRPHQSGRLLVLGLDNAGKTTLLQAIRRYDTHNNNNNNNNSSSTSGGSSEQHHRHQLRSYPPTDRPEHMHNIVTIHNQITFSAYDLGGHEAVRHLWSDYYGQDDDDGDGNNEEDDRHRKNNNLAILFCIDIADRPRLEEAAYELDALIHDGLNPKSNHHSTTTTEHSEQGSNKQTKKNGIPICILLTKCDTGHPVPIMTVDEVRRGIDYPALQQNHGGPLHLTTISVYDNTGYMEALQWVTQTLVQQQREQSS